MVITTSRARRFYRRSDRSQGNSSWSAVKESFELGVKVVVALAAAGIAYVGYQYQSASQVTGLLQQREASDTQIRAEMFKAITDRLFGEKGATLPPEKSAVFTELLALNFHEHIELKPLMLEVDSVLAEHSGPKGFVEYRNAALEKRRNELRSVARRLRARQVSMLFANDFVEKTAVKVKKDFRSTIEPLVAGLNSGASINFIPKPPEPAHNLGKIDFLGVRFGDDPKSRDSGQPLPCDVNVVDGKSASINEPTWFPAPDGRDVIALAVEQKDTDWDNERFSVGVKFEPGLETVPSACDSASECGRKSSASPSTHASLILGQTGVAFYLTWFDLPLTDNTLLPSGNRFAVFIDRVCQAEKGTPRALRLAVLWFPKDYFPARERPTNYRQLREKLQLRDNALTLVR